MSFLQQLSKLDVSIGMKKDIEVLLGAISEIDVKDIIRAKEILEKIHEKVVEVEEYFWRPIDSSEVYLYESKLKLLNANKLEFKGRVLDFYGNKTKALEFYEEALDLVPDHELARPAHEKALRSIDRAKKELGRTEKQLSNEPNNPTHWFKQGVALLALDDILQAIDRLDRALELNPSDADALARRGTAMECLGDYRGAMEYFKKALKLKPGSMTAKRGKSYAEFFLESK
jgi:tetratricopeptide (TPR) repeat protein